MSKVIGIDPGKDSGVAIAYGGKLAELITTDFWGVVEILEQNREAVIVVELPINKHVFHNGSSSRGGIARTGVNVGSVIREAELLVKYLHRNGFEHIVQRPQGKRTDDEFKKITGWTGRTNQHTRDAGLLIHGLVLTSSPP